LRVNICARLELGRQTVLHKKLLKLLVRGVLKIHVSSTKNKQPPKKLFQNHDGEVAIYLIRLHAQLLHR
jgi:hypothetical protein